MILFQQLSGLFVGAMHASIQLLNILTGYVLINDLISCCNFTVV